jgi:hypothetical protein
MPSKNEKKLLAIRRAEFALRQRLERIDWEHDQLIPDLEEFRSRSEAKSLMPSETLVEFVGEDDAPS